MTTSRTRKIKRKIIKNITKIPSAKNIIKGINNSTQYSIQSTKKIIDNTKKTIDNTKKSIDKSGKRTYYGKYEGDFINEYNSDPMADDHNGSAWIKVYSVSETNKYSEDEQEKFVSILGNKNKLDLDIDEKLIIHIKEKKYKEKTGIRNAKRTFSTKKIVIPYDNIDEDDFDVTNLKDNYLKDLTESYNLNDYYIEIEENGILKYYISIPIKKYLRYAIVKQGKIKDDEKEESELAKGEKQKKLDAKKNEANELINTLGVDILSDNKIVALLPCSKLANAYCYIHPFNVILYEKKIMYGLIWEKVNFNPEKSDLYENIESFFNNNDSPRFNLFKEKFKEAYKSLSPSAQASDPQAQEGGNKQIGGGTEVIDLTGVKEVIDIVYDAKYLDYFKLEKFYYKYDDNGIEIYYLCKNSILDYRYNHKSWDKEKYYNDNSIDKAGLQSNLNSIKKLNNNLTITLEKIREKARENGDINKNKEEKRQDRSDERFNDNAGKVGFYTTQLFVYTAKYIQDTFLAGIKVLFSSSWNNVITGFLILLFIILVVIMGVALSKGENDSGNDGPNKKPKEENKDFISLLKSMPANINIAYADFNKFATNLGNMITNGRRAVNDLSDAITGDNIPKYLVRPKYEKSDGRGGDNIIHFNNIVNDKEVVSTYKPIAKIIPKQNGINSTGQLTENLNFKLKYDQYDDGLLYKLDCDDLDTSKYFTKSCKLRKDYSLDTKFIKDPKSDYEQIKIND